MSRLVRTAVIGLLMLSACAGPPRVEPGRPIEKVITHDVREGETWRSIAMEYYRDESRARALASYNRMDARRRPTEGAVVRVPLTRTELESFELGLDAVAAYNLGVESAAEGNYGDAVDRFQRALSLDPDMHDASFNLAVTYQKLGLHAKAIPLLEGLIERAPGRAAYLFALGHSHFQTNDLGRAKKAFMAALAVDRTYARALYSLAVVHEKLGERAEALRRWNEYIELDPEGEWAEKAREHRDALMRE